MNKTYRLFILLTITAIMAAGISPTRAQGYAGVIAEDPDKAAGKAEEPLGYSGVISGAVPQSSAPITNLQQSENPANPVIPFKNIGQIEEKVRMDAAAREAKEMMKPEKKTGKVSIDRNA